MPASSSRREGPLSLSAWLEFVGRHPHDFTIQYPPRREYFMTRFRGAPPPRVEEWLSDLQQILVYVHVPFCEAKCFYCNFAVDVRKQAGVHERYVDALLRQLDGHEWLSRAIIPGIDIGGGTPTRLPLKLLEQLLAKLRPLKERSEHPFPLSIETTPRIAAEEPEKMVALREGGVDRISMGVQSFHAEALRSVNRSRQIAATERAVTHLRSAGFARINLDVIFGLPAQSLATWRTDVAELVRLAPDSITTYDCLYRGHGRALSRRGQTNNRPSPEVYGTYYDHAYAELTAAGYYAPYGSVNFSRRQGETGTSAYFEGRLLDGWPYLGLGNYATSWRGHRWSFNAHGVDDYIQRIASGVNPVEFHYELPGPESWAKYLLYSLNYGFICERRFQERFGEDLRACYPDELEHAQHAGWLEHRQNEWHVVSGQFGQLPYIRSLFYPEAAKHWLMELECDRSNCLECRVP